MSDPTVNEPTTVLTDQDLSLLDPTKVEQLKIFLDNIRSYKDETKRYALCLGKRDELLEEQDDLLGKRVRLNIEFAFYESAFTESKTYQDVKESDNTWQKFARNAEAAYKSKVRWTAELSNATKLWGKELVQHYAGQRGVNFAVEFARTAKKHPDWNTTALPRLQQLVRRRIQLVKKHGRHTFTHSIERTDLINARSWITSGTYVKENDPERVPLPCSKLRKEDLPSGYTFDEHGLLIPSHALPEASRQGISSNATVSSATNTSQSQTQSASAAKDDLSTYSTINEAMDSPVIRCAHIRDQSNSGTVEAIVGSGGLASAGEESNAANGGSDSGRQLDCIPSSLSTANNRVECSSPHTLISHIPRRSARILANDERKGIELNSAKTLPSLTKPDMRHGRHRRGRGKKEAQSAVLPLRIDELKGLASELLEVLSTRTRNSPITNRAGSKRKRATSLPPDPFHRYNPEQLGDSDPYLHPDTILARGRTSLMSNNKQADTFLRQAKQELGLRAKESPGSRGAQTAKHLLPILENCKHPNADETKGPVEVYRKDGQWAKEFLDDQTPNVPIITEQQQQFQWKDPAQPMSEFFEWMGDLDRLVSVQVPSLTVDTHSYQQHSLRQVQKRLFSPNRTGDPWNVLDCSCPLPSVLPDFLTSWNCQLLARIRDVVLNGDSAERTVARSEEWTRWRDVEQWALLSEGGHCTAPHMDSHGLATWITVQQGVFGFIWMSRPTDEQRITWMEDVGHYDDGQQWRFVTLRPGQTIFFPSGTIHGVVRTRECKTLALGGHILQWSGIGQWLEVHSKQALYPDSTNEDISDVRHWMPIVEGLLRKRLPCNGGDAD